MEKWQRDQLVNVATQTACAAKLVLEQIPDAQQGDDVQVAINLLVEAMHSLMIAIK